MKSLKGAPPRYDLDGHLLSAGRWTYRWEGENRLVKRVSAAWTQPPHPTDPKGSSLSEPYAPLSRWNSSMTASPAACRKTINDVRSEVGGRSVQSLSSLVPLLFAVALRVGARVALPRHSFGAGGQPPARLGGWLGRPADAIAFTVLFASYHYLVRSSFIGRMLNGQSYPFVAWPFAQLARRPDDAAERETL